MRNGTMSEKASDLLLPLLYVGGLVLLLSGGLFVVVKCKDVDRWFPALACAMGVFGMCTAHALSLSRRIEQLESKQ